MIATVKKLSVCHCGFPAFNPDVTIGTEYEIRGVPRLIQITWICGGCHEQQSMAAVFVEARGTSKPGWVPIGIFGESKD